MPKCTFVCGQESTLPALVPTALTLHCTFQNLLNLYCQCKSTQEQMPLGSDCKRASSCSVLKFTQQLWRCVKQIISESAFGPCQVSHKQNRSAVLVMPEFSKRDLLQQAKGMLLWNLSGLKARFCWTKHPAHQFDLAPAVIPKSWRISRLLSFWP